MCADSTYLTLIFFGLTSFLNISFIKIFLGIAGSFILIYLGLVSAKEFFHKAIGKINRGDCIKILLLPVTFWLFPAR